MAKEVDLKIELKVTVDCCDGCKKKVKKVLRSIEGVYKTEIDPVQPKVTVVGNVEPQTLIKKLLTLGKQAEIWRHENQNAAKEKKEVEAVIAREQDREKSKPESEQAKCFDISATAANKIKESAYVEEGGINKSSKRDQKDKNCKSKTSSPEDIKIEKTLPAQQEVTCMIHPSMSYDKGKVRTDAHYCYMVEPYTIALPYYAVHPYQVPTLSPPCCRQDHSYYGGPVCQLSVQMPVAKAGDYFSDENTTGCDVM
ncbi:heavy metal-associated isoprenylated plant protein 35-like isoform X2 [Rhododendron vialii]|uniref:heavy metal-associated isoprenylated plant protein 35-like isoform X2 n=1 Tax=Rhododendron vialii TaxID=182163 RepID=UPI00265DCE7A|nr:heavy metal-associated isoprenylated plant protein 35-like isoform X2 [Rhododendron vialii]